MSGCSVVYVPVVAVPLAIEALVFVAGILCTIGVSQLIERGTVKA